MPDEKGNVNAEDVDDDSQGGSSLHAYKEGREDDIIGDMPEAGEDPKDAVDHAPKTGGATSGGPPRGAEESANSEPPKAGEAEESGEGQG